MAGVVDGLTAYFICVMAGVPLAAMAAPLFTALWRQNVPGTIRGQRYSVVSWIGTAMAVVVSLGITQYVGDDAGRYRLPVIGLAVMLLAAAGAMTMISSQPLARPRRFPLPHLNILWEYPLFGYISAAWMLMGFANLATIPLRAEYVSSPEYGLAYSPDRTLVLVLVIPVAGQLASMLIWGRLFDVANFLLLRIAINVSFGLSIAFFFAPSFPLQIIGSSLFGIAAGGGAVAWAMWVTKYSPPEKTADFMAVHTFLTGLRGVAGPVLAFHALDWKPIKATGAYLGMDSAQTAAWICIGLITVSILLLVPIIHTGKRSGPQPATAT
jgi:MFS family permease